VARLVRRLDGMPLAIELAAARAEALGVSQLLRLLDDRLALLAGGDRLAAGRHRSLAAAAQWSYQLLADQEQRVFRLLSVFPAPFTLDAAEAVAGQDATPAVLRLVTALGDWWSLRGRLAGQEPLLRELAGQPGQ
jgi:non-specific serine/threonine protein kinase